MESSPVAWCACGGATVKFAVPGLCSFLPFPGVLFMTIPVITRAMPAMMPTRLSVCTVVTELHCLAGPLRHVYRRANARPHEHGLDEGSRRCLVVAVMDAAALAQPLLRQRPGPGRPGHGLAPSRQSPCFTFFRIGGGVGESLTGKW